MPFKQSVGSQEKHAVATLYEIQMRLPCLNNKSDLMFQRCSCIDGAGETIVLIGNLKTGQGHTNDGV